MGRYEIGHIQKRILTALKDMDDRYITDENRPLRWVWMNVLVIMVYNPQQLEGKRKEDWDWTKGKNEARRIWESVKGLEKRGLIETRIVTIKDIGFNPRFGKCQRWMEVRVK